MIKRNRIEGYKYKSSMNFNLVWIINVFMCEKKENFGLNVISIYFFVILFMFLIVFFFFNVSLLFIISIIIRGVYRIGFGDI